MSSVTQATRGLDCGRLCEMGPNRHSYGESPLPARELRAVDGRSVPLPDPQRLVHLQLRRFAGCPACNLHLRSVAQRHEELSRAGVREVVVFRSPESSLREHAARLPFELCADPQGLLYRELGVGRSLSAVANPRAWPSLLRGSLQGLAGNLREGEDPLTLPADFLVDSSGRIVACKYGEHADDQWSVDEILSRAERAQILGGSPMRNPDQNSAPQSSQLGYWITTGAAAVLFIGTGIANLARAPHIVSDMAHLGYPSYFPSILGAFKLLGAATILAPRLPRLKEWAYAGMLIDLTCAALSRAVTGDGLVATLVPLCIAGVVLASWAQRPASRRLERRSTPAGSGSALGVAWAETLNVAVTASGQTAERRRNLSALDRPNSRRGTAP